MPDTRTRIVAATNELFRRHGYHATSLKEITAASAATVGSIYHFFPRGKAELAGAVISETGAAYRELFELVATDAVDPASAVGAFFDGAADTLEESGYLDVCPIGTVAREVASTDEVLRVAADAVFASWVIALARHFEGAGLHGSDAHGLATTVVAALEGGFILARTRCDAGLLRQIGRRVQSMVAGELASTPTGVTTS